MVSDNFLSCERAHAHTQDTAIKVKKAIRLLQSMQFDSIPELAYSGGKDSDVLLWLCKQAGIKFNAVYKSTTIDPPGTIAHVEANKVNIIRPKENFLQLIEKKGLPTMWRRFCCQVLKEYYTNPIVFNGVRSCESVRRKARYKEPTTCRVFSKKCKSQIIMPLLNFTNEDIETLITKEHIQCHPLYYDEKGKFHVERRLGCIGCPLQSDRGRFDYLQYPKLFKQVVYRFLTYCNTHNYKDDPYIKLIKLVFYSNHGMQKFDQHFHGLFPANAPKTILEEYFQIELP